LCPIDNLRGEAIAMTVRIRDDAYVAVLHAMAGDPAIVDDLVAAARSASPVVAQLPVEESRRHVAVLLAAGLAAFEGAEPSERDFAEATRLGADRAAQGVPLAGLLAGIQAGRTRALQIAIERGRAAAVPDDTLVQVLLELDGYTAALERHVIEGHHAAERELARSAQEARARALRRVLTGQPRPDDAARLGLDRDRRYHVVVGPAAGRLPGGPVATVDGWPAGLVTRAPATGDELLVVAPAAPLARAPAMYRLCVLACRAAARTGATGNHGLADLAGAAALEAQPVLAGLVCDALLGDLDPADEFHRELAGTALAYLDHGQRLDQAAAALHVHPNTVRYRLRRLGEIAGPAAAGVDGGRRLTVLEALRLWWALDHWLGHFDA
jgi:hypothetical protein